MYCGFGLASAYEDGVEGNCVFKITNYRFRVTIMTICEILIEFVAHSHIRACVAVSVIL